MVRKAFAESGLGAKQAGVYPHDALKLLDEWFDGRVCGGGVLRKLLRRGHSFGHGICIVEHGAGGARTEDKAFEE